MGGAGASDGRQRTEIAAEEGEEGGREWETGNWRQATGDIRCRSEKSAWRQIEVKVSLTTDKTEGEVGDEGAG